MQELIMPTCACSIYGRICVKIALFCRMHYLMLHFMAAKVAVHIRLRCAFEVNSLLMYWFVCA